MRRGLQGRGAPTWQLITSSYKTGIRTVITGLILPQVIVLLTAFFHARQPGNHADPAVFSVFGFYLACCLLFALDLFLKIGRARSIYARDATVRRFEFSQEDWKYAVHSMAARDTVPGKNDAWYYSLLKKEPVMEIREKTILIAGEVLMEKTNVLEPERFVVNDAENRLEVTFIRKRLRGLRFFPREDVEFSNRLDVPLHAVAGAHS
jgi:hypothetical protein